MNDRYDRDDERYSSLLGHFGELVTTWQHHRDSVGRAINLLSQELVELRAYLRRDEQARVARQQQLDEQLATVEQSIAAVRRNQRAWLRVVVIIALLGVGALLGWLFFVSISR